MAAAEATVHVEVIAPRLLKRNDAALYMGMAARSFDKIKHKYRVATVAGDRYDRVLIDRDIDLQHAA